MEVKLIVASGKSAGKEIPVSGPKFFIGRSEDCHLRPHSDQVSRHHCAILIDEGTVVVRDFGSKNGTYVNGERVKTEHELKMGDRLSVGPLDFEVRLIVDMKGKKKPKVKSVQEAAARTVEAASVAPSDDDAEVADWLLEGEEEELAAGATRSLADTDTIDAVPTEQIDVRHDPVEPFAGLIPDVAGLGEQEPKKEGKEPPKAPKKGGTPASQKPAADSSRSAAADVLRELFKRK